MGAVGSGKVIVTDCEVVSLGGNVTMEMGPGNDQLPRLQQHAKMYDRYRLVSLRVEYVPLSGTATSGNVTICLLPGPRIAAVKDASSAMKVKPCLMRPAWKAGVISANKNIDSQKFLYCDRGGEDGVVVTIYAFPSAPSLGVLNIHYQVEMAFPKPF